MGIQYTGSCHCQSVVYKIDLEEPITKAISCNCSICRKKGTWLTFIAEDCFTLISGEDRLKDYQFGVKSIHHYFCSQCGVTPFAAGTNQDGAEMRAINIRCIDDFDLDSVPIGHFNGKEL